jgi:hypothetical protein
MKTKIIITSMIAFFAFSSFQLIDNSQNYKSIIKNTNKNFDLKKHKSYFSQAIVSCTKCHDCQNDNPIVQDSLRISIQDYSGNFKKKSIKVSKAETEQVNKEKTILNDVESNNNLKPR